MKIIAKFLTRFKGAMRIFVEKLMFGYFYMFILIHRAKF